MKGRALGEERTVGRVRGDKPVVLAKQCSRCKYKNKPDRKNNVRQVRPRVRFPDIIPYIHNYDHVHLYL